MTGTGRMLVAGVGNIFKSDDGFATEVVARLERDARHGWPQWVRLHDYGIGGIHLAYELLEGYDELVLVDAMQRPGGRPGTVYVLDADPPAGPSPAEVPTPAMDAHDLDPATVLALVRSLGGTLPPVTVVGCEPESTEDGMGLSQVVAEQVDVAARIVDDLVTAAVHRRSDDYRPTVGAATLD
ncbi:MAG: hydrogenase maturation protease [Lapillicoccus sp.]